LIVTIRLEGVNWTSELWRPCFPVWSGAAGLLGTVT
jgi:hypothetical protein